jgi:hypothetical protein
MSSQNQKVTLKALYKQSTYRITELQEQTNMRVSYGTLYRRVVRGYFVSPGTVRIVLAVFNHKLGTNYTEDDIEFLPEPGEEENEEEPALSSRRDNIA